MPVARVMSEVTMIVKITMVLLTMVTESTTFTDTMVMAGMMRIKIENYDNCSGHCSGIVENAVAAIGMTQDNNTG